MMFAEAITGANMTLEKALAPVPAAILPMKSSVPSVRESSMISTGADTLPVPVMLNSMLVALKSASVPMPKNTKFYSSGKISYDAHVTYNYIYCVK